MHAELPAAIQTYADTHGFAPYIDVVAQRIEAITVTVPNHQAVYRFVAHHGIMRKNSPKS